MFIIKCKLILNKEKDFKVKLWHGVPVLSIKALTDVSNHEEETLSGGIEIL
jgi:hypothetical protein